MARRIPTHPAHPERICWGCEKYCAANDMRCGNGTDRTQHPVETFGPDWMDYVLPTDTAEATAQPPPAPATDRAQDDGQRRSVGAEPPGRSR